MIEILMNNWTGIVFGLLCIGCLLLVIFINICYQEIKRETDDEYADLKKMMPKLPKEKKKK